MNDMQLERWRLKAEVARLRADTWREYSYGPVLVEQLQWQIDRMAVRAGRTVMSATLLISVITSLALIDVDGWTYTGEIQGEIGGQQETVLLLYEPLLFALEIPETATTEAGTLVVSEFDLWPPGFFELPHGPFHFTSVVDNTVSPETGFFNAALYTGETEAFFRLVPIEGDTAAISYRGSTILLQPGEYVLTIPEPSTLLLALAALAGLMLTRRVYPRRRQR